MFTNYRPDDWDAQVAMARLASKGYDERGYIEIGADLMYASIMKQRREALKMKEFKAWAIDTKSTEGHGLLGRYFFGYPVPASSEGCVTALFKTRAIAREHCKNSFKDYTPATWKPKVIKVKVIIELA